MRSNFWGTNADGTLDVAPGCDINSTIREAVLRCFKRLKQEVVFMFNGVKVRARYNSDPALLYRDWFRALSGYIAKDIGPYPKRKLSRIETENDKRIADENDRVWAAKQAEYDRKAAEKQSMVNARLADAPPMEIGDANAWEKTRAANPDGYGGAVVSYAERWARLMQVEMSEGRTISATAKQASHDADLEGITGFMYGCAVAILSKCWKHGEDLRRWHNLSTQIGNEGEKADETGGVLNPAVLSLGT